jgi:hypothetical protein
VSSADFSSTSGWTATKTEGEEASDKPVIEAVYGRFENGFFKSCIDDIRTEKF